MKQFLESLIKSIVENPDAVKVKESQDEGDRHLLTISVDNQDMGRVIGKSGKVINAIRTIMRVVAIRQGIKIRVDIEDEAGPPPSSQPSDSPATQPEKPSTSDLIQPPEEEAADSKEATPAKPAASEGQEDKTQPEPKK